MIWDFAILISLAAYLTAALKLLAAGSYAHLILIVAFPPAGVFGGILIWIF